MTKKAGKGRRIVHIVKDEGSISEQASGDYFDQEPPTLDNPPKEDDFAEVEVDEFTGPEEAVKIEAGAEGKGIVAYSSDESGQTEIPGAEKAKPAKQSRRVKYSLKLQADGYVIPVAAGEAPADMVEEVLLIGINSERFRDVLREVVGAPLNAAKCDSQTSTAREELLSGALRTALSGLGDIGFKIPKDPERDSHEQAVNRLKEIVAIVTQKKEAVAHQLAGEEK